MPVRFLKDGAEFLKTPITYTVNLSIQSNVVPDDFKLARVCPLYNKKVAKIMLTIIGLLAPLLSPPKFLNELYIFNWKST